MPLEGKNNPAENPAPQIARLQVLQWFEELKQKHPEFEWIGIYRRDPSNPNELVVFCFIGPPTPHTRIPIDSGICGAAVCEAQSINVPNVQEDSRYLACSLSTKSELVIPIRDTNGEIIAELDIDCSKKNGFSPKIQKELENFVLQIENLKALFD